MRSRLLPVILLAGACPLLAAAAGAPTVTVVQKDRSFSTAGLQVAPGTVVRFTNEDDFPHQVHVSGPGLLFDSPLQELGQHTEVALPRSGLFLVRCGVHPKMRLTVTVRSEP